MTPALYVALLVAAADWFAVARHARSFEYVLKPAVMAVVIAAALLMTRQPHDAWQARWFIGGFALSLAGDVFLVLPPTSRRFLAGLVAFLLAHLCYIVGLNPTLPPLNALLLLAPCAVIAGTVVWRIVTALRASGLGGYIVPVVVYGIAMTLMVFSAWATLYRPEWTDPRRFYVISGATLFFVSDAILAWNRFVRPLTWAPLAVMVTYHLGQIGLAASIALT
jgi:uncharacterized membrane protein YhhN